MLVLKHVEYPNHSEHWSELKDGTIHITGYYPGNEKLTSTTTLKRKQALEQLKYLLKKGLIIMVNNLFTNEEL